MQARTAPLAVEHFRGDVLALAIVAPAHAEPAAPSVLVLAVTGHLGRAILAALASDTAAVSVFSGEGSDRAGIDQLVGNGRESKCLSGDLLSAEGIGRAFEDRRFDSVVNAVRVEDGALYFHEQIMAPLLRKSRRIGVHQFIDHSAVGAGDNVGKFRKLGWERVPGMLNG